MQVAVFGLGKMGMQIAKRLHAGGFGVLAWNRGEEPREELNKFLQITNHKLQIPNSGVFAEVEELVKQVENQPRVFWLMLPHEIVEEFLQKQLMPHLKPGDIVIDGGNSFYKDSIKRGEILSSKGVVFYDCGTSGGVWGEKNGFALMIGGPAPVWPKVEPIFKALSSGTNYGLVGQTGAGHFVKMVHNGIEYGMMEAIAEGYGIMKASEFSLDFSEVTRIYQQGTVIRSWLIDLTKNIFDHEDIEATSGYIHQLGEGKWTVDAAKELGVDARVIEDAVKVRDESLDEKNQQKFSNKIVALLRKQFGGHGVKK